MLGYYFTNLLAAAAILAGWLNPMFGLMVYYAFAILRPTFLWFWSWNPYDQPRYSFYMAMSALAGWFFCGFGDWSGLKSIRLPVLGYFLYLFGGLFSWKFFALRPDYSWDAIYPQLTIGLMMLMAISLFRSEKAVRTLAWIVTASLGYLAWVFNSQYYFDGWNRIYWNGFGGIDNNGVAMIMVMGVPLSFFMGIHEKRIWVKGLCFLAVLLEIHVVLFSFSRGGQLGLCMVGAAVFVVALLTLPRKFVTVLLGVLFVIVGLRLAGAEVRARFMTIFADPEQREASAQSRLIIWPAAWKCFLEHPLGLGPRGFNLVSHQYGLPPNKSVHNLYIQTAVDYGIFGLIGLVTFYLASAWKSLQLARSAIARQLRWPAYTGTMVCISVGGMMLCSFFIGMESVEVGYIISLIGLASVAHVDRIVKSQPRSGPMVLPELEEANLAGRHEAEPSPVSVA